MMDIEKDAYYTLNSVAKRIWELLDTPLSVDALCQRLINEYDIHQERCHQEVLDFLARFQKEGMIRILSEVSAPLPGNE